MTKEKSVEEPIRPNLVVSISAPPKSGKTHLALSFPEPILVYSLDLGGVKPLLKQLEFAGKDIRVAEYPIPIIDSDPPKPYAREVWNKMDSDFKDAIEKGKIRTIVLDTGTAVWQIIRHSVAEEVGQKKLLEVQYTLPNLRMNSWFTRAKTAGVNLVSIQYLKDKYVKGENTGEVDVDGWSRIESTADICLWLARKDKRGTDGKREVYIETTIKDNRYDLQTCGTTYPNLTYEDLCALLGV